MCYKCSADGTRKRKRRVARRIPVGFPCSADGYVAWSDTAGEVRPNGPVKHMLAGLFSCFRRTDKFFARNALCMLRKRLKDELLRVAHHNGSISAPAHCKVVQPSAADACVVRNPVRAGVDARAQLQKIGVCGLVPFGGWNHASIVQEASLRWRCAKLTPISFCANSQAKNSAQCDKMALLTT